MCVTTPMPEIVHCGGVEIWAQILSLLPQTVICLWGRLLNLLYPQLSCSKNGTKVITTTHKVVVGIK